MAVWSQVKVCWRRLSLGPIGCKPALSVTQQLRCSCSCRLWRYINVMPLPLFPFYSKLKKSRPLLTRHFAGHREPCILTRSIRAGLSPFHVPHFPSIAVRDTAGPKQAVAGVYTDDWRSIGRSAVLGEPSPGRSQ